MLSLLLLVTTLILMSRDTCALTYVTRAQWGARPAKSFSYQATPVPNVVIHHTAGPACRTQIACVNSVRSIQNSHMNGNGWDDIGYSFVVGGDNRVYIARGWDRVGAHAPGFNSNSIGINVVGTWTNTLPPAAQLQTVKNLIADGVRLRKIRSNYRLLGHRQATATECPGNALYRNIQTCSNLTVLQ